MNRIYEITAAPEVRARTEIIACEDNITTLRVHIRFPETQTPTPVSVTWAEPMTGLLYVGHPFAGWDFTMHQKWAASTSPSCFCFGAPLLYTIGPEGQNGQTVAVSDPCTPISLKYWVDDFPQKYQVKYQVNFFDGMCDPLQEYTADIRIDTRPLPFYQCVREAYPWWQTYGWTIPAIPAAAEDPLYSSWYNFHQTPNSAGLLPDLEIAAELGFRTVILDDGWQFEGQPKGADYRTCGDWQVAKDKFPDFRGFTQRLHQLGMKLLVWFTVPFIGVESQAYHRFEGKYLSEAFGTSFVLDPRYPEVRAYILDTYKNFLRDYDIDGFKLDFIDSFAPGPLMKDYDPAVMDCVTVNQAVQRLLTQVVEELAAIKPELLFEYRQNYVGPAINRFGNMLRVGDCAYDAQINRVQIAHLRMFNYPVAVHSDMLYWAKEESIPLCARQLLNVMFSVPQISVILTDSTEEQKALVQAFLRYWTENRELLLHGEFIPCHPEHNFTRLTARGEEKEITVLYADQVYTWSGLACDLFHNGDTAGVVVENAAGTQAQAEIFDCFGRLLDSCTLAAGSIARLPVPVTGMVRLTKR